MSCKAVLSSVAILLGLGLSGQVRGQCPAETAKLLADDGAMGDLFGISVSIDGDSAVVGASSDQDNGQLSGSAYVFRFDPVASTWSQEAKLVPTDGAPADYFGGAVDRHRDPAIHPRPGTTPTATGSS